MDGTPRQQKQFNKVVFQKIKTEANRIQFELVSEHGKKLSFNTNNLIRAFFFAFQKLEFATDLRL